MEATCPRDHDVYDSKGGMMPDLSKIRGVLEEELSKRSVPFTDVRMEEVVSVTVFARNLTTEQRRSIYAAERELSERFPYTLFDYYLLNYAKDKQE
jgi:hypothetical protein